MTHVAPLVAVILASSLLAAVTADSTVLCTWTKVSSNRQIHYSFLRTVQPESLQMSPSTRLFHSVWSAERALLRCAWSEDAAVIAEYFSVYAFSDPPDERFHLDSVLASDAPCVPLTSPSHAARAGKRLVRSAAAPPPEDPKRSEVRSQKRVKRGFIVPGTLWCGSGNKAPSYEDLGVFADTDSCCREHDQCKDTILSFQSDFGVFNSNIFTMSHCDCDNKFRSCLMEASDSISDVVGYTFFNLLKMQCFEFSHRLQCAERNWFGMCKEMKMALYAEVHPPTLYAKPAEPCLNQTSASISTTVSASGSASTASPTSASITPPPVPDSSNHLEIPEPTADSVATSAYEATSRQKQQDSDHADKKGSCEIYKDLDECRYKILPQQKRFGLLNPEPRTLYHCNCTNRLFQNLAEQKQLSKVQVLLLEHVSESCFFPQACTAGNICTVALIRPDAPQQRGGADMEEQRHLLAMKLKVRRPNSRRAKRKDRAVRLQKLCLRIWKTRSSSL
ncbi:hypothetical protein LDENG_00153630 [Lucifuga dentata]|nr:hypothetical protein LDENG_00153630 [Lucifuga dentata]